MELIKNNPYRIAGILSNATAREIEKQKGKIKAFSRVGREITSEFDFDVLGEVERSAVLIDSAFSKIQQNKDKVNNSLFWFLKASPFDETAITYLKNGDDEKALEIWGKITNDKEVNSKNFSAFNNIGTLKLLSDSESVIKEGIASKIKLIESVYFENFVHTVADEAFIINSNSQSENLIDELLKEFNSIYSSNETFNLFSNCNGTTHKYLSKKLSDTPIHNIEIQIENTKQKRKVNKKDSYKIGAALVNCTKKDLLTLKSLLGISDLKYKMIADNLSKEIMQCGIDYFQVWKETNDPSEYGLKLLKYAKSIAVGSQTKDRVKENIEGIQEWAKTAPIKDDLASVMNELDSFQNKSNSISNAKNLINLSKPRLQNIRGVLGSTDEFYLSISSAVVNNALEMIIAVFNSAQSGLQHNRAKLLRLPDIVSNVISVLNTMDSLDMNSQTRSRYLNNKSTIVNVNSQLDTVRRQTTSTNYSGSSESEGIPLWLKWVGGIILFIILTKACN